MGVSIVASNSSSQESVISHPSQTRKAKRKKRYSGALKSGLELTDIGAP
jgi:hypothetical protein